MVPSIRSRRVVSNGGPHLSVAHDLTCCMTYLGLDQLYLKDGAIHSFIDALLRQSLYNSKDPMKQVES